MAQVNEKLQNLSIKDLHNMEEVLALCEEIEHIQNTLEYLQNGLNQGILDISDTAKRMEEMKQKEFKIKEKAVLSVHKNKITSCQLISHGKMKTKYQTRCSGKRPRLDSYEALIEYLYTFYFGETIIKHDYSFKTIYEEALQNKIRTEEPKEKTIRDYRNSYKAFITEEFEKRDIRTITPSEMKEYIQRVAHDQEDILDHKMSKKRFYKFKGVLNLAFDYAADHERQYIPYSPVPKGNHIFKKNLVDVKPKPEDKAFQPEEIELIRNHLWTRVHSRSYDVLGYAILFSTYTGVREGEIPSLKWSDINFSNQTIHIHSQQLDEMRNGKKEYYYEPTTKNEKGVSRDGRFFPFVAGDNIDTLLSELKKKQKNLGIETEWVFAKRNGDWIKTDGYYSALYYLCKGNPTKNQKGLGLSLSNNHAFRMALNSYEFIPKGLNEVERAKLLGHSPEVNLKHYTFSKSDEYIDELREKLAGNSGTSRYLKIIPFQDKRKSPENRYSQGL